MDTNRSASASAGYDEENPYKDADLKQYDPWWRENIRLFQKHGMRPYRPPQFADGVPTPKVVKSLEDEFDISIQFRVVDPQNGNTWEIRVDDERIRTVGRYRDDGGFSVYEIKSGKFKRLLEEYIG